MVRRNREKNVSIHNIDFHMHSRISDGTDSPEELVARVREAEMEMFSITDHDSILSSSIVPDLVKDSGLVYVPGAEFSCQDEEGKYHILGYGYDPNASSINELVERGHGYRMIKVRKRLEGIKEKFSFTFTDEEVEELLKLDNPGKPHIGLLMVKHGYAPSKEIAIKEYLDKIKVPGGYYIRSEEAISAILRSGGVPVLAHPSYGSGDQLILGEEMDARVKKLCGFGIQGLEAFYSGFPSKLTRNLIYLAEQYDLMVSAGSDYHGKNKMVTLGDTGVLSDYEECPPLEKFLKLMKTKGYS